MSKSKFKFTFQRKSSLSNSTVSEPSTNIKSLENNEARTINKFEIVSQKQKRMIQLDQKIFDMIESIDKDDNCQQFKTQSQQKQQIRNKIEEKISQHPSPIPAKVELLQLEKKEEQEPRKQLKQCEILASQDYSFIDNINDISLAREQITQLNQSLSRLFTSIHEKQHEKQSKMLKQHLNSEKNLEKLNLQIQYLKEMMKEKQNRILQLMQEIKKKDNQSYGNFNKQIRKCLEILAEKENELQSLKRQNILQKKKVSQLEHDIGTVNSQARNQQIITQKLLEQLKNELAEISTNCEDLQLDKIVLETKYKTTTEKIEKLIQQQQHCYKEKDILRENYEKCKEQNRQLNDKVYELMFQVAELKINQTDLKANIAKLEVERQPINPQQSDLKILTEQVEKLVEHFSILKTKQRTQKYYSESQRLLRNLRQSEDSLKQRLLEKQLEIQDLKGHLDQNYAQRQFQLRMPQLYQYLLRKKQEIEQFQQKMTKIENYIEEKNEAITKLLTYSQVKQSPDKQTIENLEKQLQKQNQEINSYKKQLEITEQKIQSLLEENQKMEQMQKLYQHQIKDILDKKTKKKIRCNFCLLSNLNIHLVKCNSCKFSFHEGQCKQHHSCDNYDS